jgi:predicted nucleic acid-binding protein
MPDEIFVDASAWIAVTDKDDNYHSLAVEVYPTLLAKYRRLVTSNLVVAETHAALRLDLGHQAAMAFLENVRSSPRLLRVHATQAMEDAAVEILRRYDDQDFSYADAVSFALMKARGIKEAFAFDRHFATMGFRLVPALRGVR